VSKPKYSSMEEYYDDIARQTVEDCTLCGDCVRSCPIFPVTSIKDKAPEEVMEKVINFLKDGVSSEEAYVQAYSCSSCGRCSEACPQGIDVMEAFGAARIKMVEQGKIPEAVNFVETIPGLWRTISKLEMKPSEMRWLEKVPPKPEKTENVVFLGCTLPASPHTVFALLDVFESMGIDFVALAGGELCCGFPFFAAGKVEGLEQKARELVASVKAFSPKRLILPCAGCYRQFTKLYPLFQEVDFQVQYYTDFLTDNLDKMNLTKPLAKTVYFHDSCMSQSNKCNESVRKFLENIPGLKVIKGQDICCGGTPKLAFFEIPGTLAPPFRETLAKETIKTGSDYLVNLCQLCELTFSQSIGKHSFGVKDPPAVINEAMGGKQYQNKWPEFWKCQSDDEIIEKFRENFEANGLTEEEVRMALPILLSWKM